MRIHSFQHVPFEDLAYIDRWATANGAATTTTRFHENDPLPALTDFDFLVILGGPMNVYEQDRYPWLAAEKKFIGHAIAAKKSVLGICLGAQLIADVLGGTVTRNAHTEIGWYPVTLTDAGKQTSAFRGFPSEWMAFHWHGDTFSIPPGAVHAAGSAACANQAFVYQERVVGLQCHLEYTPESIETMIREDGTALVAGSYIQSADQLLQSAHATTELNQRMGMLLENLIY